MKDYKVMMLEKSTGTDFPLKKEEILDQVFIRKEVVSTFLNISIFIVWVLHLKASEEYKGKERINISPI